MRHRATGGFWTRFKALPPEVRKQAKRCYAVLKRDPHHPSLRFKKVGDELWSARIGRDHRALALQASDGFTWIWIGRHDEYVA